MIWFTITFVFIVYYNMIKISQIVVYSIIIQENETLFILLPVLSVKLIIAYILLQID